MPWVKFTDDWYDDEDMADASPLAIAMWAVAITWSARNLTDGRIPRSQVRKLLDLQHDVIVGANCLADDVAAELVKLGKWTVNDRGFTISNYHKFQPTREKVLADREKDRKRKPSRTGPVPDGIRTETEPDDERNPERPVPVPDVSVLSSSRNSRPAPQPVDDDEVPSATWQRYAQLKLDRQPAGSVSNETAWKRTAAKNARTEHADQALRWWRLFDISPERLAECLIDGRAPADHYRRKDPA